jgi:ethanolamine utilization protein EutJ
LKPVVEKVSSIITKGIEGYGVEQLVLVGGSSCLTGIEEVVEKMTGIPTYKPADPFFVTPLGIALGCTDEIKY